MGFTGVTIKTDCQNLIYALRGVSFYASQVGLLLQDCAYLLREMQGNTFVNVKRASNMVADAIAKTASSSSIRDVWKGNGFVFQ